MLSRIAWKRVLKEQASTDVSRPGCAACAGVCSAGMDGGFIQAPLAPLGGAGCPSTPGGLVLIGAGLPATVADALAPAVP